MFKVLHGCSMEKCGSQTHAHILSRIVHRCSESQMLRLTVDQHLLLFAHDRIGVSEFNVVVLRS